MRLPSGYETFKKLKKSSIFPIGSRCIIKVPSEAKTTHAAFDEASIEVVSKQDFLLRHPIKVEVSKVICKILAAPNAPKNVKVVGLEYPIRRSWLVADGYVCNCDFRTVIMVHGCQCGGY